MSVQNNFDSLDLVPVGSLLKTNKEEGFKFYVPAYQRGYRWTSDQVEQLIEDLEEFDIRRENNREAFYCIQPLVVKPIKVDGVDYLEVIDGQQRLTTILLLQQVLHQLQYEKFREETSKKYSTGMPREAYLIKYETRPESTEWLYNIGTILFSEEAYEEMDSKNCDYSHFAEVFKAAYDKLKKFSDDDLIHFKDNLNKHTYFIWYLPNETDNKKADIFDRLNAGKIGLNNAELVKALFLQRSNVPFDEGKKQLSLTDYAIIQKIGHEWDDIEKQLRDDSLWGFIYSKVNHELKYANRIEYFLDLEKKKTVENKERYFYTFNSYLNSYRQMLRGSDGKEGGNNNRKIRLEWVVAEWDKIKKSFELIKEWYKDRHLYHRIGFIIELNSQYNLRKLEEILPPLTHTERIEKLDEIIRETLKNIKTEQLFYPKKEMSVILYLYNILLEDRRYNSTARFSFADYKQVTKDKGWDQEHVASNRDHEPTEEQQGELANDVIELITGKRPVKKPVKDDSENVEKFDKENTPIRFIYKLADDIPPLESEELKLCESLLTLLNPKEKEDSSQNKQEELEKIYNEVFKHFKVDEDPLKNFKDEKREKDFIWNFVLLNATTNRSYGNNIFPVKRRRILSDEFEVYTPVGTRNVFEKAYSRKINHFLAWTRSDAKAYWDDIKKVLKEYILLKDKE